MTCRGLASFPGQSVVRGAARASEDRVGLPVPVDAAAAGSQTLVPRPRTRVLTGCARGRCSCGPSTSRVNRDRLRGGRRTPIVRHGAYAAGKSQKRCAVARPTRQVP
jgi:hypothetical protein